MATCNYCLGMGGPVEITCQICAGTGYDPQDDKPFAQCHTCYGDGTVDEDVCPWCNGIGELFDGEDQHEEYRDADENESSHEARDG